MKYIFYKTKIYSVPHACKATWQQAVMTLPDFIICALLFDVLINQFDTNYGLIDIDTLIYFL